MIRQANSDTEMHTVKCIIRQANSDTETHTVKSTTQQANSDTIIHTVNSIEWPGPNWAALEYSTD